MYINTQIWIMFFLQIYFYIFVFLYCKLQHVYMTIFNFWHTFNNHLIIERTNKTYKILQILDFVKDLFYTHTLPLNSTERRSSNHNLFFICSKKFGYVVKKMDLLLVYFAKNVSINRLQFEMKINIIMKMSWNPLFS